ncbi:MAG: hypothetical protein HYV27_21340 [Candidatus Hydrogenedentes bacterium]|nr:hypothetical protein [Candidatus Hydrogenedentota bacterium]
MFFNRNKRIAERARQASADETAGNTDELFMVTFEQMQKGHIVKRGRETVRQCAIIIDGYMHLVTSGEHVTREVYLALVEKGYLLASGNLPLARGVRRPVVNGRDELLDR